MTDFFRALKDDLLSLLKSRVALFLAGWLGSGTDVPAVIGGLRGFLGL
jgi:hypothetical protein